MEKMEPNLAKEIVKSLQDLSWYEICRDAPDMWLCVYNRELSEPFVQRLENIAPQAKYVPECQQEQSTMLALMGSQPIGRIFYRSATAAEATRIEKEINDIMREAICITRADALRQIEPLTAALTSA